MKWEQEEGDDDYNYTDDDHNYSNDYNDYNDFNDDDDGDVDDDDDDGNDYDDNNDKDGDDNDDDAKGTIHPLNLNPISGVEYMSAENPSTTFCRNASGNSLALLNATTLPRETRFSIILLIISITFHYSKSESHHILTERCAFFPALQGWYCDKLLSHN